MSNPMRIAIASGKGGTGKTTIATNLAVVLADEGERIAYVDCDVEEPNGHIFLKPTFIGRHQVTIPVPEVDESHCTFCGVCGSACRYSAILMLPQKVLTFPALCHGCGGCSLACPVSAIREVPRSIGIVEEGLSGNVAFLHGRLDIGEAMAPPVIKALLDHVPQDHTLVLDAPPGTSCPVIESVKSADVVLLVTEPTPFGLNDLKLAVEMVRELGLPFGVAVNRVGIGDRAVYEYCEAEKIPVLLELPDEREIAYAYSRGELAVAAKPQLRTLFLDLYRRLDELAQMPKEHIRSREAAVPALEKIRRDSKEKSERMPSENLTPGQQSDVCELVVISGKGGTGKTSIVASLFSLAERAAVADCDVDAADLHLVLDPSEGSRWPFSGGHTAVIDGARCTSCGLCAEHCRFDAVLIRDGVYEVDPISCEGCGVCADVCPDGAAEMVQTVNGEWFVSDTRRGPMVHARLGIAQENSGKLVSLVRREGKAVSVSSRRELLIGDGSPGIGCPVIASITGAHMVLVVTEPTLSGLHDLERVIELTRHFNIETGVCINKVDINPEVAAQIVKMAAAFDLPVLGCIRYDEAVTEAQVQRMTVVEFGNGPAAQDIRALWKRVHRNLHGFLRSQV